MSIAEKIHPKHSRVLPRIELLELQIQGFEPVAESLFHPNQLVDLSKTEPSAAEVCFAELEYIVLLRVDLVKTDPERLAAVEPGLAELEPERLALTAELVEVSVEAFVLAVMQLVERLVVVLDD